MRVVLALVSFAFVIGCLAVPTARQVSAACAGLGGGAFDNASNFTIAALNKTLPNANTTGAPLVLGQAGAVDGAEFEVLSTWASYPFNDWPSLSLVNAGLIANRGEVRTTSSGASSGSEIVFTTSTEAPPAAQVYCAVANTDPAGGSTGFPVIALNTHTDLFSLCMADASPRAQNNVVYNATANNPDSYLFETCYPVTLQLIFVPQ